MALKIDVLSLFCGYFRGPLDVSILKKAQERGLIEISLVDIRDYSQERFQKVDDRPYGGGPGMVMMADPVVRAIRAKKTESSRVIYLSPQGSPLTAKKCRELAALPHLILLCGHYEGIDQRAIDLQVDEEISIGDFVLTNGCLASLVLIDGVSRFVPGVLGAVDGASLDSFEEGILDWPQYTRPEVFEGEKVPEVLLSGNHAHIEAWRRERAREKTQKVRPDLWKKMEMRDEQA
jgi:tRNA (guanine37-N1)-methyltransferase